MRLLLLVVVTSLLVAGCASPARDRGSSPGGVEAGAPSCSGNVCRGTVEVLNATNASAPTPHSSV